MIFQICNVKARESGLDAYKMPIVTFSFVKTAEFSIQLITQRYNESDIRFKDATHIALTFDKSLKEDMQIEVDGNTYTIKLVNNAGRMAQLTLRKEK